jgi:transposase-like protein
MIKPHRDCFNASVAEKRRWFKDATWDGELGFRSTMALKDMLQHSLEEEAELQLGVARYQRSPRRRDYRNGSYTRTLDTPGGSIDDLRVPRSRHGTYQPQAFNRYQRRMAEVDELILGIFLAGASTRRVGAVLEVLTGHAVSASTVSNVAKALDAHVREYHHRPLQDRYLYLLLDGIRLRCKGADGCRKVLVLTAYGITAAGHRELIDFCQAPTESEAHWTRFLESLRRRGLEGNALVLVTTDGAPGLIAALNMVYPFVHHQRCWVHKLRNVANKLRPAHRDECQAAARLIYLAPTRREAVRRFKAWKRRWQEVEPKAVACLAEDIEQLLACFQVPEPHRIKVRTTNAIERSFREVRRRTNPMSCFNNPASIDRIIFAVFAHLNDNWEKHPIKDFTQKT